MELVSSIIPAWWRYFPKIYCDNSILTLGSIKFDEFLDLLRTGYLLRENSAAWS